MYIEWVSTLTDISSLVTLWPILVFIFSDEHPFAVPVSCGDMFRWTYFSLI